MKNMTYTGIPSTDGMSATEAIAILLQHCQAMAEHMVVMNQEIEALKLDIAQRRDDKPQ